MVSEFAHTLTRRSRLNVLILVLLEDGIGVKYYISERKTRHVLILVLLEDGIGVDCFPTKYGYSWECLNPCFTGRWYRRQFKKGVLYSIYEVLILVLLEDGIGDAE